MLEPLTPRTAALPLALLALFLLVRGILPAWQTIDTDFPNYYAAGKIVAEGTGVDRLYDDRWFQEQIARDGMELQGKFSPFPPPTALLFAPLAAFEPLTALRIMTTINLLLLLASVAVLARIARARIWEAAMLILLSGLGLANCLRFGQLYIALSLSLMLGFLLRREGHPLLAGIAYGVMIPIKYFPLLFLVYYCWKREWHLVFSAVATAAVVTIISVAVLGWEIHRQFLFSVAGAHLQGMLTLQDPFSSTFQSFDSLLRRLFVLDTKWNPEPVLDAPLLYPLLKATVAAAFIFLTVRTERLLRRAGINTDAPILAIVCIAGLLLAPATATYHMVILWLPAALLLREGAAYNRTPSWFWLTLTLYTCIGFIPYRFFSGFDLRGVLALFAYPRLWLLLTMFAVSVAAAARWARFPSPSRGET